MIPTEELTTASATQPLSATASAHLDLARGLAAAAVAFQHLRALLILDWSDPSSYARSGDWRPLQPCAVFHIACQSISSSISTDRPPDRCAHLHSVRKSHAGHVRTVSMARRTSAAYSNPLCGSGWLVHRLLAVRVRDISALRVSNEDDTRLDRAETLPAAPALGLSTTEFVGFGSLQREPGCGGGERRLRRSQYEVDSIAASGPMK